VGPYRFFRSALLGVTQLETTACSPRPRSGSSIAPGPFYRFSGNSSGGCRRQRGVAVAYTEVFSTRLHAGPHQERESCRIRPAGNLEITAQTDDGSQGAHDRGPSLTGALFKDLLDSKGGASKSNRHGAAVAAVEFFLYAVRAPG